MSATGECITATARTAVVISELAIHECSFLVDRANARLDGEAWLWIGAIGPLAIRVTRPGERPLHARFKKPLDPRIVDHFAHG